LSLFSKKWKRTLQGVHTYDLMRNPHYSEAFQYVPVSVPKGCTRAEYIIDDDDNEENDLAQSDLVKLVLNLPYMTEKRQKDFEFSTEWYTK